MSEKVTLSPFAKKVKTYLSRPKNFDTPRRIAIYVLHCYHAVHLGLLSHYKFLRIVSQLAILRRINEPGKTESFYNPANYNNATYATYNALFFSLNITPLPGLPLPGPEEWIGFLKKTKKHNLCYQCDRCICGCGKDAQAFYKQEAIEKAQLKRKEQHDLWSMKGYDSEQIRILELWRSACWHGRWNLDECNCTENNILAQFKAISRDWLKQYAIQKRAIKMRVYLRELYIDDSGFPRERMSHGSLSDIREFTQLTALQKTLVSRHFYFCSSREEGSGRNGEYFMAHCRHLRTRGYNCNGGIASLAEWLETIYFKVVSGQKDANMYFGRGSKFWGESLK